jgi:hypothetical protein
LGIKQYQKTHFKLFLEKKKKKKKKQEFSNLEEKY